MSASLPARANLEFLKKQAKELQRAFTAGDADAVERIRTHLPRAGKLPSDDVAALDLSLQEAQHALACEYGFGKWEELLDAVQGGSFEDVVRLTDRETQILMREVDQKDLITCLIGASEPICERFLGNMSQRVQGYIRSEIELAGDVDAATVTQVRQRVVQHIEQLREQGWIQWPPAADAQETSGPPAIPEDDPVLARVAEPLSSLSIDELAEIVHALAEQARREGILSLERLVSDRGRTLLTEGILLVVDGTEPDLVVDILEQRSNTILHNRTTRGKMAVEAWMAIHSGDNPAIVAHKLSTFFVEDGGSDETPPRAPTQQDLVDAAQADSLMRMPLGQLVEFYRDLAFFARHNTLSATLPLVEHLDEPILQAGMWATDPAGTDGATLMGVLEPALEAERQALHERHCLVILGLSGLQRGRKPDALTAEARERARAQAEQLPPDRLTPTLTS